jgi:hypothetical protein
MAIFRKLHTAFWTDPFVENLTQEQKLFYLYLITNTKTKQCGIYEISKKYISYETGFSIKEVSELIKYFVSIGKIYYSERTNEIAISNWWKHNWSESPKTLTCIKKELLAVKDTLLIGYLYSTDKLSIVYPYSIDTPLISHTYSMYTESQEEEEQEEVKEEVKEEVEVKVKEEVQQYSFKFCNDIYNTITDNLCDDTEWLEALETADSTILWNNFYSVLSLTTTHKEKLKTIISERLSHLQNKHLIK